MVRGLTEGAGFLLPDFRQQFFLRRQMAGRPLFGGLALEWLFARLVP